MLDFLWNKKELISTFDLRIYNEAVTKLIDGNIEYQVKTSGGYMDSFGESTDLAVQYRIFVKKDDFEEASYLLNK